MKEYMSIFNKYVKGFDLKNKNIMRKFHHTYRVVEYANDIAVSLKLNDDDIVLAKVCALFHDIARFIQATQYNTFIDSKSFDHGDKGYEIVKEFIEEISDDKDIQNIVLYSIKNHNKKEIQNDLSERERLFCNITRDADKLDIMMEQAYQINDGIYDLKKDILDCIYNHELVKNKYVENDIDHVCRVISFIFDINYKYSLNIVKNIIINKKFELLEVNIDTLELKKLKDSVYEYLEKRIKELCQKNNISPSKWNNNYWVITMIIKNFKYSREMLDVKQKDIAELFNVHFSTVSDWETGKDTIPIERLVDYANHYNYSLDYLFGIKNYNEEYLPLTLDLNLIAHNLKILRKKNNYTQEKLAKKLNTNQASYAHYENATNMIPTVFLYNLTTVYKPFSIDKLLGRKKQ